VGRNPALTSAFAAGCGARNVRLFCHHHDFFFHNRWGHWPAWQAAGAQSFREAWQAIFPPGKQIWHRVACPADAQWLARHFEHERGNFSWPTPIAPSSHGTCARSWLRNKLRSDAPVWLMPCRLLRRKNCAEGILLARLLRPEAAIVITGGASSAAEVSYAQALQTAGHELGWPVHFGVLSDPEAEKPSVESLMEASEAILLPSLFESVGLPTYEAARLGKAVIARHAAMPHGPPASAIAYAEVLVPREVFDWHAERLRQQRSFVSWKARLPADAEALMNEPPWWENGAGVPFSRLSLEGQLEILRKTPSELQSALTAANPWLSSAWSRIVEINKAPAPSLPDSMTLEYCARLLEADFRASQRPVTCAAVRSGADFRADERFVSINQYPLLWSADPIDPAARQRASGRRRSIE